MKFKDSAIFSFSLGLFVLFIAGGLLLSCGEKTEEPKQEEEPSGDIVFFGDHDLDPKVKQKLISMIGQDNQILIDYFAGKTDEANISEILGEDAVLTKENGMTIQGNKVIIDYFNTLDKVTEVKFKTELVHVKSLMHIKNIPEPANPADIEKWNKDVIDVFCIITSFSYKKDGKLIDPLLVTSRRHNRICDIEP